MKKILVMSALVAFSAAFVACSSDDDLVQAPVVKGTPVKVVLGGTRANIDPTTSPTTTANLSTFQLYGVQQTSTPNFWMDNVKFTKNGSDWESSATWPVANKETVSKFYGFSDGVTDGTPAGLTPSIAADAQSFAFTFGTGTSSSQWFAKWSETDGVNYFGNATVWNTMKTNQGLRNETTLKSEATVLDNNNLTDLLVTYDNTTGVEGTDGTLNLNFKHALSNLIIRAMFVGDDGGSIWPDGTKYYIQWIRVHGLYHTATYTFGTGWSIDATNDSHNCAYEHVWGESDSATPDPRWTMDIIPYAAYNALDAAGKKATYVDIVPAGEFMIIPQTITSYDGYGTSIGDAQTNGQCYIEMYGYFRKGDASKPESYNTNGEVHYYPLKLNNAVGNTSTFEAGKKHVVVIDLTSVLKSNGTYAATPSQAGGN